MPTELHLAISNVSERLALERIAGEPNRTCHAVDDLAALMAGPVPPGVLIVDNDFPGLDLVALLGWHGRRQLPDSDVLVRCLADDHRTRATALRLGALDVLPRPGGLGLVLARLASLRTHELRLAQFLRGFVSPAGVGGAAELAGSPPIPPNDPPNPPRTRDVEGPAAADLGAELLHGAKLAVQNTLARWAPTADFRTATPEDVARARSDNPWIATTAVAVRAAGLWLDVTIYGAEPSRGVAPVAGLNGAPSGSGNEAQRLGCVLTMLARCAASVAQERVSGPVDVLPNCVHRRSMGEVHPLTELSPPCTSRFVLALRGEFLVVDLGARQAARRRRRVADLRPGDVLLDDLPGLKPSDPPLLGRGTVLDSRRLDLLRTLPPTIAESREVGVLVPSERYLTHLG